MNNSKSIVTMILLAMACNFSAFAKHKATGKTKPAFDVGSKTIGIFLGAGVSYDDYDDFGLGAYTGYTRSFLPSVGLIYDQGIKGNVGPGTIGIGGVLAYKHSTITVFGDKDYASSFVLGVRGTYHLTLLKDKIPKFDPYGGATLGLRFTRYSTSYDNTSGHETVPVAGLFIGAGYKVANKISAFAELGYDITIFRAGISFSL